MSKAIWIALLVTLLDVSLPTPLFAQVQNLNLAWDPSNSPDIEHHNVYVGTASGAHDVAVTAVPASQTTYPFPATAGVLYYFAVSAVTTEGVESPRSQEISWSVPLIFSLPARTSVVDRAITAVHVSAVDPDGGVLRFSHTGLPLGLVLDSVTGTIVGIPRSIGTFDVTIFVSDGVVTSSQTFAWTIRSPGSADTTAPSLSITSHTSGQSVTTSTITLSGTATDSGLGDSGITRVTVNGLTATGGSASGSGTAHWSRSISLSGSTNTVLVEALDGGGNYSAELITLTRETNPQLQPITAGPLAITSLTSNLTGPQAPGSVISFTADASGGTAPYQYKWWVLSGGVWTVAREWSSSATLNWQPTTAGSYVVAVWGRNAGVTADASQALAQVSYDISNSIGGSYAPSASPANFAQLTLSSLTSNLASPQVAGTTVTFSAAASGGTAPYQYKWWLSDGTAWSAVRDWSTSPSMTWRPTTAGQYTVAVWARNAGVTVDANQTLAYVTYDISSSSAPVSTPAPSPTQLTLSSLTSDLASPQVPGTAVTFSAAASGGAAPYEYKWWLSDGTSWSMVQDWSTSPSMTWQPTAAGPYTVAVWARNAGVTVDANEALAYVTYDISSSSTPVSTPSPNPTQPTLWSLTSDLASPQLPGTTVTFSAAASGGAAPYQYKWWVSDGTSWSVVRDWNTSASMTWRPTTGGIYTVAVWVRNYGVAADSGQAIAQTTYAITSDGLMPLVVTGLSSSVSSPRSVGDTVDFTASASGGSGSYQFKWWVWDGSVWAVAQSWSLSPNLTWRPTGAGTYMVAVWVRNLGVIVDASEALAQVPYIVMP